MAVPNPPWSWGNLTPQVVPGNAGYASLSLTFSPVTPGTASVAAGGDATGPVCVAPGRLWAYGMGDAVIVDGGNGWDVVEFDAMPDVTSEASLCSTLSRSSSTQRPRWHGRVHRGTSTS
jgi:hypothetical protein